MSEYVEQRVEAAGLRHITLKLTRGDVQIERIEGDAVVIASDDPIAVERYDDILQIGPQQGGRSGFRGPRARVSRRLGEAGDVDVDVNVGSSFADFGAQFANLSAQFADLGAQLGDQIGEVVSAAMGSFGGLSGADVRIGVPAIIERPTIEVTTGQGDLKCANLTAEWSLKTGFGDVESHDCGGVLTTHSGKGDIEIERFSGAVQATTGAGDVEARQIAERLSLRTGTGDVEVEECAAGGVLHTGSGDVEAEAIGGSWQVRTGSGDVTMRMHGAASLEIVTGSGDVEVRDGALQRLRVHTSSGDVTCASLLIGSRHEIISGHGDVELALADPPGARLQILTGHGDVSSVFPLVRVGKQGPPSHGSARYVGNVGDSTIDVELRTSSGDVSITRLEPDAALRAMARDAQAAGAGTNAQTTRVRDDATGGPGSTTNWTPAPPMPPIPPVPPVPPVPPMAPEPPMPPILPMPPEPPIGAVGKIGSIGRFGAVGGPDTVAPIVEAESQEQEAQPSATSEDQGGATAPSSAPAADAGVATSRLQVLQALQRGEISVAEATSLLDSLT